MTEQTRRDPDDAHASEKTVVPMNQAVDQQRKSVVENLSNQKSEVFDALAKEKERVLKETVGLPNPNTSSTKALDEVMAKEIAQCIKELVNKEVDRRLHELFEKYP